MIRCGHVVFFTSEAVGVSHPAPSRHCERPNHDTPGRDQDTSSIGSDGGTLSRSGVGRTGTLIGSREPPCQPPPRGGRTRRDHDLIGGVARGGPARRAPRTRDQRADTGLPASGARTDSPAGLHHVLQEGRVGRSSEWLLAQSRLRAIAHARLRRGVNSRLRPADSRLSRVARLSVDPRARSGPLAILTS